MKKIWISLLLAALFVAPAHSVYTQWAPNPQPLPAVPLTTLSRVGIGTIGPHADVRLHVSQNNQPTPLAHPIIRWSLFSPNWAGQVGIISNNMPFGLLTAMPTLTGDVVLAAGTNDSTRNNDLIITDRHAGGRIRFGTAVTGSGDVERMTITSIGRVGMGTTAPQDHLHIHQIPSIADHYPVMRLSHLTNGLTQFGQLGLVTPKMLANDPNYLCFVRGWWDDNPMLTMGDLVLRVGGPNDGNQDIILANRCGTDGKILFSTTSGPGKEDTVRMRIDNTGIIAMGNPPNPWATDKWKVWIEGPAEIGSGQERGSLSLLPHNNEVTDGTYIYNIDNYYSRFRLTCGDLRTGRVSILEATSNGNVLIGGATSLTTTWLAGSNYKLQVNGSIRAKEILVETDDWPDYVFASDYSLPSLAEVEQHIRENQHLPGIPSAAEMESGGVKLGEMQAKMLQKIEELTLYVIEQNKKMADQQERIQALETQLHSGR